MFDMSECAKILTALKAERALVEEAIAVLHKLIAQRAKAPPSMEDIEVRRGRPAGSKNKPKQPPNPNR